MPCGWLNWSIEWAADGEVIHIVPRAGLGQSSCSIHCTYQRRSFDGHQIFADTGHGNATGFLRFDAVEQNGFIRLTWHDVKTTCPPEPCPAATGTLLNADILQGPFGSNVDPDRMCGRSRVGLWQCAQFTCSQERARSEIRIRSAFGHVADERPMTGHACNRGETAGASASRPVLACPCWLFG